MNMELKAKRYGNVETLNIISASGDNAVRSYIICDVICRQDVCSKNKKEKKIKKI